MSGSLHVVFRVDTAEYALPASEVVQMESFTGATPVPGAPPFVAGLVQLRGRVVPVIDLRLRFGLPAREPTLDTRVVVAELGERTVGLVVDSAREVLSLAPDQIKPPPPLLLEQGDGVVKAVARVGARLILLIDFGRLIGDGGHGLDLGRLIGHGER